MPVHCQLGQHRESMRAQLTALAARIGVALHREAQLRVLPEQQRHMLQQLALRLGLVRLGLGLPEFQAVARLDLANRVE